MSSRSKPRFSIVIPAYNEAHYIADTLDSLSQQNFRHSYEIIVVDNNSTDQTAAIARSIGAKVVEERRPGVCWARQAGTEVAEGEIVISTDADTTFGPAWLARIDERFKKNEEIIAVAGPCRFLNGPIWGRLYPYFLFGSVYLIYKSTGFTYYASATNIAFKKSAWEGYDTKLAQGGDEVDLIRRLRKHGKILFDNSNPSYTSARRLVRGLVYNLFVSFFIYYLLEYNLSRLFKRPILGMAPKFRNEFSPRLLGLLHVTLTLVAVVLFSLYTRPGHYTVRKAHSFIRDTREDVSNRIHNR